MIMLKSGHFKPGAPSSKQRGGCDFPESGISSSDAQKPDISQPKHSGDIPSELPETVANENLDNANMMGSSNQTPNALLGKGDAIDSPDDEHKGPTEPAEPVVNEVVDNVDPEELSAKLSIEGFGEARTLHLSDASLSRSDETDRTTVDDHVSGGRVLETSKQAFSEAVETVELLDDPMSQLMEDVLRLINQSSPATSVQTLASSQNYVAAEGVSQLPSHQADALNPPSLIPDPLMYELERNQREALALLTSHQEMLSSLKPECEKELEEAVAQIRRKYKLKEDEAIAQYTRKNDELFQSRKKIVMNKWLADAFMFKCSSTSDWPLPQQGSSASSMQGHQQFVRPTAPDPQISCIIGQSLHQASVPHAPTSTHVTSQTGQSVQQAPVIHATRPAPTTTNQNSAAQSVLHATGRNPVTGRNGQPMQQVPHATMLEPVLNQNFAAQSVQAAQQAPSTASAISNLRGMN